MELGLILRKFFNSFSAYVPGPRQAQKYFKTDRAEVDLTSALIDSFLIGYTLDRLIIKGPVITGR